jgi:hypothetical protein
MNNEKGLLLPNIGFGAYYFKKDYFIGVSAPKMFRLKMEKRSSPLFDELSGRQEPTIFLMGGVNNSKSIRTFRFNQACWQVQCGTLLCLLDFTATPSSIKA